MITATETEKVSVIIDRLKKSGISQVPILDGRGKPVAIVKEIDILRGLQSGKITENSAASAVAEEIGGLIYPKARVEELFRIFETDNVAIVVDSQRLLGVISKIDVIDFVAQRTAKH